MSPTIDLWRIGIVELAAWACGYSVTGRSKKDPVYVEVTENGHGCPPERYSSCADLVHWLAKRVGVRQAWVNRTDDFFGSNWQFAVNVSRIASVSKVVPGTFLPEPGDMCISWNNPNTSDAHVWVYLGPNSDKPGEHWSANYGAGGMAKAIWPGAKLASKPMRVEGSALMYGTRRVQRVLTVPELVKMRQGSPARPDFSGPDLDATPWTGQWSGEVRDALEGAP